MPFLYLNKKYLWALGDKTYQTNDIARERLVLNICAGLLEDAEVKESDFCDGVLKKHYDRVNEYESGHEFEEAEHFRLRKEATHMKLWYTCLACAALFFVSVLCLARFKNRHYYQQNAINRNVDRGRIQQYLEVGVPDPSDSSRSFRV